MINISYLLRLEFIAFFFPKYKIKAKKVKIEKNKAQYLNPISKMLKKTRQILVFFTQSKLKKDGKPIIIFAYKNKKHKIIMFHNYKVTTRLLKKIENSNKNKHL